MEVELSDYAVELACGAIITALKLSLPMLLVGLVVGFIVSLFQAVTQIQEQTLTFVPKILSVGGTLFILMPWMLTELSEFTHDVFSKLSSVLTP